MKPLRKALWANAFATGLALTLAVPVAHSSAIRLGFDTNTLASNDDDSTGLVSFGFSVDFFGNTRSGGYVNNNGNITLDSPLSTFTPFSLSSTNQEILAPFFADVDTRSSQDVTYGTGTVGGQAAFGANWVNVGFFNAQSNPTNSFQALIIDRADVGAGDFDIEFNIDRILWETGDASGGTGGLGGSSARLGWSNGSTASFELPGSAVNGAFLDNNLSTGLIYNQLNSALSDGGTTLGRYFFQVRNGEVVPEPSVPEPGVLALMTIGLVLVGARRAKKAST